MLTEPSSSPEPTPVAITRLVCTTLVVLTVLIGAGMLLLIRPEYSNAALALIGVVIGASFGIVSANRPRRSRDHT
jgi:hypothetical protein